MLGICDLKHLLRTSVDILNRDYGTDTKLMRIFVT
jgi:hypothetical protein